MSTETLVVHNVVSPDGFTISIDGFTSKNQAKKFFKKWLKGFKKQGYYSAVNGKISYADLKHHCEYIKDEFRLSKDDDLEDIGAF
ncbi:hypothetical protein HX049_17065 [Myroides odoratimimus]|uniref:hypothetical protein n=1 Tax=Myroides odoratimimus TaxID=76832 RepID=UPI0025752D16|nr:hypothetical protein [Myroides odoratimimus]MDM1398855.1 hypothetical protein [Myroides odoratimimus]